MTNLHVPSKQFPDTVNVSHMITQHEAKWIIIMNSRDERII